MSLNGLDDVKVTEAYQSALAEAGGWFLLKYTSRDAVELFTRGTGGLAEARGAVAQYEEKSPLYGFLLYRRRKVLIKYIPEGTSRLLQARVSVHFQAVAERFSPHDTIVPITSADELNDSALISACALHTAAPSSCSSSGSSRRHKLDGITEDAEEGSGNVADDTASIARPATAASSIPTIVEPSDHVAKPWAKTDAITEVTEPSNSPLTTIPSESHGPVSTVSPTSADNLLESPSEEKPEIKTTDYRDTLKNLDALFEHGPDPRFSSQTARPSVSDLYSSIYDQYKPKVKLGPRPRPSMDSKRPHTSGNGTREEARPVSTLPAGLRIAQRKTDSKRPKSRDSSVVPSIAFPPPPPVPNIPEMPLISPLRPTSSPGSVRSLPAVSRRTPGITPEKQRLMKALELRKKQQKAQKEKEARRPEVSVKQAPVESPALPPKSPARQSKVPEQKSATAIDEMETANGLSQPAEESEPQEQTSDQSLPRKSQPTPNQDHGKDDSGADVMSNSQGEVDDRQSSASASSPTSAQTHPSSDATSTRPSSLSEGEDHTVPVLSGKAQLTQVPRIDENTEDAPLSQEEERDSIESSPTVVPENISPVPSLDTAHHPISQVLESDGNAQVKANRSWDKTTLDALDPPVSMPKRLSTVEIKEKRRALVEPIQVNIHTDESDAEYLSDDSFMEELQSATLQEAKPVSVAKSPMSPFFPRKSSVSEVTIPERSSSNQHKTVPGRLSPEQTGGNRTSAGSWFARPSQENVAVAKKINVSSGISQRIKALAEKSNRDSVASVSPTTTPDASTSMVAQRKSSFFTSSPASGSPPHAQSTKRFSRVSVASFSSPTPNRQSVLQPEPSVQAVYNVQQPQKIESVQVTARIVRDPRRTHAPNLSMPTESTPLELHQSPIIINHQKPSVPPTSSKTSLPKPEPASPRPPPSPTKDAALPRSSSESSWRSIGRRMSESRGSTNLRSQSTVSLESFEEKREEKKDKKDSRTSRLFKRMSSSMTTASRKSQAISPTLKEEEDESMGLPALREPPPSVQVGDLNVQFPDTLLWKRRWVEIDASGYLVLTLSKANEHPRGITKRYHLSEFRAPYAPDQDCQELPNSVILDFLDGRTLQCACETHIAQSQVLQILREAHDAWMAYGQI